MAEQMKLPLSTPQLKPDQILLGKDKRALALKIAYGRRDAATVRPLESGADPLEGELQGIYAELAVVEYFGLSDPIQWVYPGRSAPSTDLRVGPHNVGIKATKYWRAPHLIVRPYDTTCDRYILVAVVTGERHPTAGQCKLMGWIGRGGLLEYDPAPFREGARASRNVPFRDLQPMSVWGSA